MLGVSALKHEDFKFKGHLGLLYIPILFCTQQDPISWRQTWARCGGAHLQSWPVGAGGLGGDGWLHIGANPPRATQGDCLKITDLIKFLEWVKFGDWEPPLILSPKNPESVKALRRLTTFHILTEHTTLLSPKMAIKALENNILRHINHIISIEKGSSGVTLYHTTKFHSKHFPYWDIPTFLLHKL